MPDGVQIGDARHEQVVRREVRVADEPAQVELSVDAQDLLSGLGDLEVDAVLVLSRLGLEGRRAVDLGRRVVLALKHGGHAEALPVEHDDGLPVVELQELGRERDARLVSCGRRVLPRVEAPVDVDPPRPERVESHEERRRQPGVHVRVGHVLPVNPGHLGLVELKHLDYLRLQQPQLEVVICHMLVARLFYISWRVNEASRRDVLVIEK